MNGTPDSSLLIEGLNNALNRELQTVMRYVLEGSSIQSIQFDVLRKIYSEELVSGLHHSQYLADSIVRLGRRPTADIAEMPHSHELPDVAAMIESDLKAQEDIAGSYKALAEKAEAAGSGELREWLDAQAAQKLQYANRLRCILSEMKR